MSRDGFTSRTVDLLAKRAASTCSNPECHRLTNGPSTDPTDSVNIGVGAHIRAASPGGPRFDSSMTAEERSSPQNGIWLCQVCAKLVDDDEQRYCITVLEEWKQHHEAEIERRVRSGERREQPSNSSQADPAEPSADALQLLHALTRSDGGMAGEVLVHGSGTSYTWDIIGAVTIPSLSPRHLVRVIASMESLDAAGLGTITGWKGNKPTHFAVSNEGWIRSDAFGVGRMDYWWRQLRLDSGR